MGYDPADAMREEAEAAFWEELPKDLHEGSVREYLGHNGDAIEQRVARLRKAAQSLFDSGHLGPSLTVSVTALEVMIHYFCIKPLVQGAFLSDLWADTLARWIVRNRPSEQRALLVGILKVWGIDLQSIKVANGKPLWDTVHSQMLPKRNDFVHEGSEPSKEDVALAMECDEAFHKEIVGQLAKKLGFILEKTGKWSEVVNPSSGSGPLGGGTKYGEASPFRT
jgi:hypothetical protein